MEESRLRIVSCVWKGHVDGRELHRRRMEAAEINAVEVAVGGWLLVQCETSRRCREFKLSRSSAGLEGCGTVFAYSLLNVCSSSVELSSMGIFFFPA